jgi:hypothetical protein
MVATLRVTLSSLPSERPYYWRGRVVTVHELLEELDPEALDGDLAIIEPDGSLLIAACYGETPRHLVRLRCRECLSAFDRVFDGRPTCASCPGVYELAHTA